MHNKMSSIFLAAMILSTTAAGAPTAEIGHYVKIFERQNCVGSFSHRTIFPGECVDAPAGKSILVAHPGGTNLVGWLESGCLGEKVHQVVLGMACYNFNEVHTGSWSVLA